MPTSTSAPPFSEQEPAEQGGPNARGGFRYQDYFGVLCTLDAIENDDITEIQYETFDDITLKWRGQDSDASIVELIQVKNVRLNQLWTIAKLCQKSGSAMESPDPVPLSLGSTSPASDSPPLSITSEPSQADLPLQKEDPSGTPVLPKKSKKSQKAKKPKKSLLMASLSRATFEEDARFRLVTMRPPAREVEFLALPFDSPARTPKKASDLSTKLEQACKDEKFPPDHPENRDIAYWTQNTLWEHYSSNDVLKQKCLNKIAVLAEASGTVLLRDQQDKVFADLLAMVRDASDAPWYPYPDKKKKSRYQLTSHWEKALGQARNDSPPGDTLEEKLSSAHLNRVQIDQAKKARRDYAHFMRTSNYTTPSGAWSGLVDRKLTTLYSQLTAGMLVLNGQLFHLHCIEELNKLADDSSNEIPPRERHLVHGAMYNKTGRCTHAFVALHANEEMENDQ